MSMIAVVAEPGKLVEKLSFVGERISFVVRRMSEGRWLNFGFVEVRFGNLSGTCKLGYLGC